MHLDSPDPLFLDFLLFRHFQGLTSLYKKFFLLPLASKSSILVFLLIPLPGYTPLLSPVVGFNKSESLCERVLVAAKVFWEMSECAILQNKIVYV